MFSARMGFMYDNTATPALTDVLVGGSTSPTLVSMVWSDSTGFGSRYSNPAVAPIAVTNGSAKFNSANNIVLVGGSGSPFVNAYNYTVGTGFGTKYANPGTLPSGSTTYVSWNTASGDTEFIMGSSVTPFISAYKWSSGFGTKYSTPASAPAATAPSARFNSTGAAAGVSTTAAINYNMYAWTSAGGFGTRYSNPGTQSGQAARGFVFSGNNNFITYCGSGGGLLTTAWSDSTGFGSSISNNGVSTATIISGAQEITTLTSASIYWNIMGSQTGGGGAAGILYCTPYSTTGTVINAALTTTNTNVTTGNNKIGIRTNSGQPTAVAVVSSVSPYITAYAFNSSASSTTNPIGAQYSNPGTILPGATYSVNFSN
jgi:hypothetical protein